MPCRRSRSRRRYQKQLLLVCGFLLSCSRTAPPVVIQPMLPVFPPQKVMETGRYDEFLKENEKIMQGCQGGGSGCDVALFNLGFVYAYAESPHRDVAKAMPYFEQLITLYPQSPWAFQGKAWQAFLAESLAAGENRRKLEADLRDREETIHVLRARLSQSRDIDIEIEKKQRELLR
jgi:hypothetical protein